MIDKPDIYVLSDLHFDYCKYPDRLEIKNNVISFINLLKENRNNNIFILAGDFFNDLNETLNFFDLLEKEKIYSFVVLGNHDYWSNTEPRTIFESNNTAKRRTKKTNTVAC